MKHRAEYGYTGSSTSPRGGLGQPTGQHLNKAHRKNVREKQGSYHYELIDDPRFSRHAIYRTLLRQAVLTRSPQDTLYIRATCQLAEQIYMAWLRSFSVFATNKYSWLETMTPWSGRKLRKGANRTPPLLEAIHGVTKNSIPLPECLRGRISSPRSLWMSLLAYVPARRMERLHEESVPTGSIQQVPRYLTINTNGPFGLPDSALKLCGCT